MAELTYSDRLAIARDVVHSDDPENTDAPWELFATFGGTISEVYVEERHPAGVKPRRWLVRFRGERWSSMVQVAV